MADEFSDSVHPVGESEAIAPLTEHRGGPQRPPGPGRIVVGEVIAVHASARHHQEFGHRLDVTVGAEEDHAELVVRVPPGHYHDLEGRHVTIRIED